MFCYMRLIKVRQGWFVSKLHSSTTTHTIYVAIGLGVLHQTTFFYLSGFFLALVEMLETRVIKALQDILGKLDCRTSSIKPLSQEMSR